MMADAAKEFVTKEIWPKLDAIDKQEAGLTVGLMEKAGELGLLGAAIPEEYGGLGENFNTNTAISMEIGKSHSFGVSFEGIFPVSTGNLPQKYCE